MARMSTQEAESALRVGTSDRDARAEAVTVLANNYFSWLRRHGLSAHDAEDVLQNASVSVFQRLSGGQPLPYPRAYIFKAVLHAMMKVIDSHVSEADLLAYLVSHLDLDLRSVEQQGENAVIAHRVRKAIAERLTPVQAKAVLGVLLYGVSRAELARQLGISPQAVSAALNRGLKNLREELG